MADNSLFKKYTNNEGELPEKNFKSGIFCHFGNFWWYVIAYSNFLVAKLAAPNITFFESFILLLSCKNLVKINLDI